jgi:uncharacterized protein (DUF433 family)
LIEGNKALNYISAFARDFFIFDVVNLLKFLKMEIFERISIDENICNGKPVIRGKRITVQTILEFLSAGESEEEILKQYPSLEPEDIKACLRFATELLNKNYIIKNVA